MESVMEKSIKLNDNLKTEIDWDGESINLWQEDQEDNSRDMFMILDEVHAKLVVALIMYAAKENGWKL
jgi:hypothetical protein